jgi:flavodoxin I
MSRVLISFATMSGNTEKVAQYFASQVPLIIPETEVSQVNMMELQEEQFAEFDLIILGSSTWTDGELNPIAEEFFNSIKNSALEYNTFKFALFGLGESYYPEFCTSVDKMAEVIKQKKGILVGEYLRLDGYVDDDMLNNSLDWLRGVINLAEGGNQPQ